MITTDSFTPTKKDLFTVMITRYFRKKWWFYVLLLIAASFSAFLPHRADDVSFSVSILVFAVVFPLLICYTFWRYVSSKANKVLFLSRYHSMDFDKIDTFLEDGSTSSTRIANFTKWERISGRYLLYITKAQYYIIPIAAFKSPEDLKWFEVHILGEISTPTAIGRGFQR